MIHQLSLEAYWSETPKLGKRTLLIYDWLKKFGAATDREIQVALGFTEPNSVRPRLTELKKRGLIKECDVVIDSLTHKRVRKVAIYD